MSTLLPQAESRPLWLEDLELNTPYDHQFRPEPRVDEGALSAAHRVVVSGAPIAPGDMSQSDRRRQRGFDVLSAIAIGLIESEQSVRPDTDGSVSGRGSPPGNHVARQDPRNRPEGSAARLMGKPARYAGRTLEVVGGGVRPVGMGKPARHAGRTLEGAGGGE